MATEAKTVDFILEQGAGAGALTARKMFGEYAVYLHGKVVALVCDDTLFVKPTEAGRALLGEPSTGAPYPGAKPHFRLDLDECEDGDALAALLTATAEALPTPKPKGQKRGT
jgi:DNA transformation protein and related proteins